MADFLQTIWQRRKRLIVLALIILIPAGILYATTFKYLYSGDTVLMETDGYGGGVTDIDDSYTYTADIDLETSGSYGTWVFLEHDSSGTTDDIELSLFASYDGTNFDDTPIFTVVVDASSGLDEQISFLVMPAPPHGRIGVRSTNTNNTFDVQITHHPYRGDGS